MTSFGWLHLTDLHLGMAEQPRLLPLVKDRFFESLKRLYEQSHPWDLVVFTGDLTFKGSTQEFEQVDEFLDQLWNCLRGLGANPSLVAVPGNHDLARPDLTKPDPWLRLLRNNWSTDPDVQKQFWKDPESEYRKPVNAAFENYVRWWEKTQFKLPARSGELPGDFSAIVDKDGASLGVVGLNTAFLQLTNDSYEEKLALDPIQFNQACGGDGPAWVKQRNVSLLLTHHPPSWLTKDSQEQLEAEIAGYDNFAVHLFGHMHEARYEAQSKGGAPDLRVFQATSLFGLEYFGDERDKKERRHGYAAGRIELEDDIGRLTFWPKHAKVAGGQWNIVVDTNGIFIDGEQTRPRSFPLKKSFQKLISSVAEVVEPEGSPVVDQQSINNRWAIMVGVNDYQYFAKLQYCRQDTIDFARALRDSQEFREVFEFHENSDLKPEREAIFQKLADIRDSQKVKPDDLLLFYFSGHGINEAGRDYLLPIGARPRDVSTLGIRVKDLVKSLKDIGCDNTLMFIDACREAVQGTKGTAAIGEDSNKVVSESGIVAFFSCDSRERSYEIDPLKHGSFTFCILEAIQEGTVSTVSELDQYLKEKVPLINAKYEKPVQQPYAVIIPPAKGDLAILLNSRLPGLIVKYGDLVVKVTELQDKGIIDGDDLINVITFLSLIESKTRLDSKENLKLTAIKALCDATWKPEFFRRFWKTIEARRLATPQIKK